MPRLALAAVLSSLLLLAGCGGSSSSGGDDPAALVPQDAAIYFEATLRPEGDLKDGALEAAGKVLQTEDPEARIDELLKEAFAESDDDPELDYERDVKPWLGEKGGVWAAASESGSEEEKVVAILSATDTDKAQEAMDRLASESDKKFSEKSYEDVDYKLNEDGEAIGIVEDFAVFGTEAEFKRTVRAASGDALDGDDRYKEAVGELSDDRLAHFYADAQGLIQQALAQEPEGRAQAEQVLRSVGIEKLGPIAASFSADGSRLAIDGFTSGGNDYFKRFGALTGTGSTPLLGELPGDAWGALGAPKLGETARTLYQQFAGALGGAAIAQQLRSELGLDLEQDVFSWIGDVAFFVRGTSADAVDGGAVIEVTDQAKAKAAFGKLVGVLQARGGVQAKPVSVDGASTAFELASPGSPQKVVAALGDDRVSIGASAAAVSDALSPSERLADGEAYGEAKELLGDDVEPGFLLSMPAVVELATAMSGSDPEFLEAKPYLEAFSVIASGGMLDDERAVSRFVAGLK